MCGLALNLGSTSNVLLILSLESCGREGNPAYLCNLGLNNKGSRTSFASLTHFLSPAQMAKPVLKWGGGYQQGEPTWCPPEVAKCQLPSIPVSIASSRGYWEISSNSIWRTPSDTSVLLYSGSIQCRLPPKT